MLFDKRISNKCLVPSKIFNSNILKCGIFQRTKSISYLELLLPFVVKASHFWEPEGGSYQTSVSSICVTEGILSMNDFIRHSSFLPPNIRTIKYFSIRHFASKFLRARKNDPRYYTIKCLFSNCRSRFENFVSTYMTESPVLYLALYKIKV